MPTIYLNTYIKADIQTVFDLSRSVELHEKSTAHTHEKAIGGKTSGLMDLNDSVTWRAKHLGFYQKLSTQITQMKAPYFFVDEMQKGIFKSFTHRHSFESTDGGIWMRDEFIYQSPLGILGRLADVLFLKNYMRRFLIQRNQTIQQMAEQTNKY